MSLSIVCGPFQPSLERAFIEHLNAAGPGLGRRVAIVSSSQKMSNRLQKLISSENNLSFMNLRFHTFYSLALEVAEDFDWSDYTLITDELFYDKLIDKLLLESTKDKHTHFHGLSSAFRSTLRDLSEACVEPVHFREHFSDLIKDEKQRADLDALLTFYDRYIERLEELGVLSVSGLVRLSTRALEEGNSKSLSKYNEILYYGFYDLNNIQADFFSAVAKAYPVSLFYPYRQGHPAFKFIDRLYELKLQTGGAKSIHLPANTKECALGESLDRLFDPAKPVSNRVADEKLRIMNTSGIRDEIWMIVKAINNLHENKEEPIDFNDIGVVSRSMEPYRNVISTVFQDNAIPYSIAEGESLLRYPVVKLALSIVTLRRRDIPVTTVLDILESPYFRHYGFQGRNKGQKLIANWKRLIHRLGVHSGWLQWFGKVSPWTKKDFNLMPGHEEDSGKGWMIPKEDTAALWLFIEEIYMRLDASKEHKGWAQKVEFTKNLLQEYFDVSGDQKDAQAWGEAIQALESLKIFDRFNPSASWDEFLDTFEEKLNRTTMEMNPGRKGVRVMNAMDARGETFKVLFLIGLNEGLFPRHIREDYLLRDSVRQLLQQPAGYWILPKLAGYEEEKLLFYLMVSSASKRLYCVFSRSDDDGKAQVPSIYLRELSRASGYDLESSDNDRLPRQPYKKIKSIPIHLLTPKEISILLAVNREDPTAFFEPMGMNANLIKECTRRVIEMNRFDEAAGMDGVVGPPMAYMEILLKKGLSPSALDNLGTCPFQFFMQRVLQIEKPEYPCERGDIAPWLKGNIYHLVLQKFYKILWESKYWTNESPAPPFWIETLDDVIEKTFAEFNWQELGVYPVLWYSSKQKMAEHLHRFVEKDMEELKDSKLYPIYHEHPFSAPAALGIKGLKFYGRPDRIDWDPQGKRFRIIDYKTHARKRTLEEMVVKGHFRQPPVYLEIVSNSQPFSTSRAVPLGVYYYILEDEREERDSGLDQSFLTSKWRSMRLNLLNSILIDYHQVENGQFVISPDESRGGHCQYCPFSYACRKAHTPSRRRAEKFMDNIRREKEKAINK